MSYIWEEIPEQTGSQDQTTDIEESRAFRVIFTTFERRRPLDILGLRECPKIFDPHPENPLALARRPEANQVSRKVWRVNCSYSTKLDAPKDQDENPLARPAVYSMQTSKRQIPALFDHKGDPYTNTAGDIVTGLTRTVSNQVITIQKNLAALPRWLDDYQDAVNIADVTIWGKRWKARHLMLVNYQANEVEDAKRKYISLTIQLEHTRDSWDLQYLNVGRREVILPISGSGLLLIPEADRPKYSKPRLTDILVGDPPRVTSEAVFLDADGRAIRDAETGELKLKLSRSEMIVHRKRDAPERDFKKLSLV